MKNEKYIPALSFDFLTGYYDRIIKIVMPAGFRERLVKQINPVRNEHILDFGTGTAALAILLKEQAPASVITAMDIDGKVLKIAAGKITKKNLAIELIEYDGKIFPFSSNCFDKVASCLVFHHLSPRQKHFVLSEIFRVLKKGGNVYIADYGLERNSIRARLLPLFKYFDVTKNIVEHGKGLLPEYLLKAGFENIQEVSYLKTKTGTLCYYDASK